jgi:hypothetical protein
MMAYDELTVGRFRAALNDERPLTEKRMMGGLCFMLRGHMVGGADRTKEGVRRFMFRLGKENHQSGLTMPGANPMVQGGRTMRGFFFVNEDICTDEDLQVWVDLAVKYASSLPPK